MLEQTLGRISNLDGMVQNGAAFGKFDITMDSEGTEWKRQGEAVKLIGEGRERCVMHSQLAFAGTFQWRTIEYHLDEYGGKVVYSKSDNFDRAITDEADLDYIHLKQLNSVLDKVASQVDLRVPRSHPLRRLGRIIIGRFI